jgi:diguanylate cyclase (GGDEF)-like protein
MENYRLAHEEPISGLPNRACLYDAMAARMIRSSERKGFMLAIFAPDNLAEILATYGSVLSDEIMRAIAQRLNALLDVPDAFFSMTGTDLVLLYSSTCDAAEARKTLARVNETIRAPIEVNEGVFYITANCGVACYPKDSIERDDMILKANLALFQAKQIGEPVVFYNEQIGLDLLQRTRIRNELPKALENGEFELFFQPQISAATDHVLGFEALLRWHSPVLGDVSPLEFIGVAEESRMILPIGAWVMKNACDTLCLLNSRCGTEYYMAVNVSSVQLRADDFVEQVLALLKETGLEPCLLELEVTESVLINRELHALEKLNALQRQGVRIALDDFGTGYSSLGVLKDLKVSTLKIDKVFIQDPSAAVLTKMIARLGHTLGAEIVAEGVETEEQLKFVRRAGCDRIQGYYRGLPMPIETLERFVALKEGR